MDKETAKQEVAKKGIINKESYNKAVEDFVKLFPSYNSNNGIDSSIRTEWENLMQNG